MPISELRGAIPYALAKKADPLFAYIYCAGFNILVAPLFYFFIATFHRLFTKFSWYNIIFEKLVIKTRNKVKNNIEKYGYIGIMLFVAVPLPITGAYTGTMGAWVLGLGKRKTILAVSAGVMIAGIIVSLVAFSGIEAFSFFTKRIFI
jgi:uncharacterized membrane protein